VKVRHRMIDKGTILKTMVQDYDGDPEEIAMQIQNNVLGGLDPLAQCRAGEPVRWVDATIIHRQADG